MKRSKNLKNSAIKKFQISTYKDNRGSFIKIYSLANFLKKNIDLKVNQINYSTNLKKGTIRGLHYQAQPQNDEKIIICLEGEIFDVIVNIKKNSKNFLKSYKFRLKGQTKIVCLSQKDMPMAIKHSPIIQNFCIFIQMSITKI